MARNKLLTMKAHIEELSRWRAYATRKGLTLSALIRNILNALCDFEDARK